MFEEYNCGCIVAWTFQGRVRICAAHRNLIEYGSDGKWSVKRYEPTGKVVCCYPANGRK